jgi:ribosomal protein S18 acetylase RimI-like enzyme
MTGPIAGCEFLEWDTAFFGIRIGRLVTPRLTAPMLDEAARWSAAERIDCLYVLSDAGDAAERALAAANGLRHVDIRVTARKAPLSALAAEPVDPRLRAATAADVPQLRRIAAESHRETRFHADPRFPHARADEMYALWIERSVAGSADHVLVGEHDGRIVGYMTGKREADEGRLVLMSVDREFRGLGFGRALTVGMLKWFADRGHTSGYLTTQDGDTAAMRLYARLQFTFDRREHWYHWWPAAPR